MNVSPCQLTYNTSSVTSKDVLHCMLSSHNSLDQPCLHNFKWTPAQTAVHPIPSQSGTCLTFTLHTCTATMLYNTYTTSTGVQIVHAVLRGPDRPLKYDAMCICCLFGMRRAAVCPYSTKMVLPLPGMCKI